MSGLPATFPCPWCGMSYPAKPVLIGKPVRCKGCRNAFVLQPDGVAAKVEDQAPAPPPPAPPPPPPAPAPARVPPAVIEPISVVVPAPRPTPAPAPAPAPAAADDVLDLDAPPRPSPSPATPPPAKPSERIPRRKTEMLEAARAQMAAQLAEVAAKAADSDAAKREEKKSQRIAKAGAAVPAGGKPAARKAVLSGEGERRHRELVRVWAIVGAAAVVALLLAFVFSLRSTVRESLEAYAAEVPGEQNRYPVLGDAVRARAWLASAPSMPGGPMLATDLSDADIAAERTIELEPARPLLAELKGLRLDPGLELWAAPKDIERARGQLGERRGAEAVQALTAARIRCLAHRAVLERLGLDGEDRDVLLDLLCGTPSAHAEPFARRMLDQGEVPARLVLRRFSGSKGSLLQDIGRPPYRAVQAPYAGALMRIEGDGWPGGWRVLYLAQAK